MGRKEKSVNSATAQTSIISKRTYTRQISNKSINQSNESNLSEINQFVHESTDVSSETSDQNSLGVVHSNEVACSSQISEAANGRVLSVKSKRRSISNKNMADTMDSQAGTVQTTVVVSSIAQRPRRQVKHKFIKSANVNMIERSTNCVANSDVSEETASSITLLNSLSPNSKLRLVPMIHRLPMNTSKLKSQETNDTDSNELDEMQSNEVANTEHTEQTSFTSILTEMHADKYEQISHSEQPNHRGRHLQQTEFPVGSVENNNANETNIEEAIEQTVKLEKQVQSHTDSSTDTDLTSAFDDDEDDIMIVEEKDALDVPDQIECVAEEVVIEESVNIDDYAEIVCISPKYLDQITNFEDGNRCKEICENDDTSKASDQNDNNEYEMPPSDATHTKECENQTEPIYLSDSLSCFDSDSDSRSQSSEMPESMNNLPKEESVDELSQQTEDDGPLNESTDDVIIVPECTDIIEIDRSDTEDNQYAKVCSSEAENNSQPLPEFNGFKSNYDSPKMSETTTDADDDSSEVEKRNSRSRRGNVVRKNYSFRRIYSKRKTNNSFSEGQSDVNQIEMEHDSNSELYGTLNIEHVYVEERLDSMISQSSDISLAAPAQDNTTDGTDDETQFNIRSKAVRTYVRRRASLSNTLSSASDLNLSDASIKNREKIDSDNLEDNTTSSGNDVDNNKSDTNASTRKRGRPRKQNKATNLLFPSKIEEMKSESGSESKSLAQTESSHDKLPAESSIDGTDSLQGIKSEEENIQIEIVSELKLPIANIDECEAEYVANLAEVEKIVSEIPNNDMNEIETTEAVIKCQTVSKENDEQIKENEHTMEVDCTPIAHNEEDVMDCAEEIVPIKSKKIIDEQENINSLPTEFTISQSTAKVEAEEIVNEQEANTAAHEQLIKESCIEHLSIAENVIEHKMSTQSMKMEPVLEDISAKIEQIVIDTQLQENVAYEQEVSSEQNYTIDFKSDIGIDASEIKVQLDEETLQKEVDIQAALAELSKKMVEDTSIRRSGRIRTIKSKQRAQGFGLVKDKKRPPVFVDEDSSNASFDVTTENIVERDVSQTSAEPKVRIKTEDELEKEKVDREKGMKLFMNIIDNEYRSERTVSKEAKKMTCDCFLTQSETERGEMGCGDDCLNRMLLIECGPKCVVGDRCTNRRFQKHDNSACSIFKTEKKGYGLVAKTYIPAGQFIMEYVGEVLNSKQFEKRANDYSRLMNAHYYFMALSSDCVIDATKKGNISRFINHSCDPNAETQKWTVNGELRIGFFSKKDIMPDEEITFDYQFQRYGKEAQKCYCEAINCRGWIGGEPESDEELESEDDEESEDDASVEMTGKDDNELSESKVATISDETSKRKVKAQKPKKPKDATKKGGKKERAKVSNKISTEFKKHMKRAEIMEDPDLDKEIDVLAKTGLKNQVQTLQFSRLMVRAKLQKAKLRLLLLLREGELPCRRLFLDYHGLKLVHSWMSDVNSSDLLLSLTFRLEILLTLENLPITNKTMLQDSKVLSTIQRWSTVSEYSFLTSGTQLTNNSSKITNVTNDESSPSDSGSGTPILNDETCSPKTDETTSSAVATFFSDPLNVESKASEVTVATDSNLNQNSNSNSNTNSPSVKPSDVLDAIPQILEQNSTLKGMGVDLLKSIISTTEKNTKIIEHTEKLSDDGIGKLVREICLLASKLVSSWEQLPESFKIPKKLRIEQMKEHEREADESYKENVVDKSAQKPNSTFSSSGRFSERSSKTADTPDPREKDPREKDPRFRRFNSSALSKHQRRQMFEAKVAQEDAERKKTMELMIHEARCAFFQLDARLTREIMVPVCVNPTTGQWFGDKMIKIPTPPSHSHIKPPPVPLPTDLNEYIIPPIDLPDLWKYAINEKGQIYYYHTKILIPQWEPPIKLLPLMEEQRIFDIDLMKVETNDAPIHRTEDDHEIDHDCDDEDEDVVSILSNSTMNANCLLELKSDPILEKYNDDDSSSIDSDDSLVNELAELEAKYSYIKKRTDDYWINMKKPPNLNEEIAAMAKSDSTCGSTQSIESARSKDEEKQCNSIIKPNLHEKQRKRKKCRSQLVQEIRISPLSDEMKRELRRDSRRYKENKAKLRRQKEIILKRKNEMKSSHGDTPVRKLKKITEGLPQVSKHSAEPESHSSIESHSFSITSFSSSRYNSDSFETKRTKSSAFASLMSGGLSLPSSSLNVPHIDTLTRNLPTARNNLPSTSLTQSIVNKLPSIGHKFVGDTEELIMKNTIKPIKPAEPAGVSASANVTNTIRSTPTQQLQQQQSLVKKPSHSISNSAKSSPKLLIKKKKTSDPNECIDVNSPAAKKIKEKFKSDISGDIVRHLKPYLSKSCTVGQIQNSDDFRHLARKLTFFVMLKELKYCNNVSLLEVTDSVKNKAREYIKKYMSKFGKTYIRDENEKDYHFEDL